MKAHLGWLGFSMLVVATSLSGCKSDDSTKAKNTAGTSGGGEDNEGGKDSAGGGDSDQGGAEATGGSTTRRTTKTASTNRGGSGGTSATSEAATGGTTEVAGSTATGGTTTTNTTETSKTNFRLGDGGYVMSGNWKGYAWTAQVGTGTTAAPTDFKSINAGSTRLCFAGTVGKDPAVGGMALLGISLNQEALPPTGAFEPPIFLYTPNTSTSKVYYRLTNNGSSRILLQIEDDSGTASGRWCVDVSSKTTGTVNYSDFNTLCWSPGATTTTYYAGRPIKDIDIYIPGDALKDVSYDVCLEEIGEVI
jgi:hypothetical protein